ncbi:MAG: relaxase/mobilization nuclease domain-containing protein [Oscillibacter sp.]|nr:relaxase/mobilization nuclease domain-containing protein [Oscillibacter sp.]MEA4994313.1 relaxase/mobilization nuclease domain-containing protein [Oscillibacter sp.]
MADRFDYGQNPDKTQNGKLITAYECDHMTADAEFLLSKAKYKSITGRVQKKDADILCYQIRQAFAPGEISPEEANRIGYETAMRWTKGRHAFFVATHTDRQHIHNHIYYNSTSLDCTRKFRDFLGSAFVLRRLSDRVCLENGLSIIRNPKQHSKGCHKHYGAWQEAASGKPLTFQEKLCLQIDVALAQQPTDFPAFLALMGAAGYEVKEGRGGTISFRAEGQERFTRLRASTLGEGYAPEDIKVLLTGGGRSAQRPAPPPRKVNLIIDIQARLKAGKGTGYERWAKVYNLKQMAAALQYLQENGLLSYEELEAKASAASGRFYTLSDQIQQLETDMNTNAALKCAIVGYAKSRPVFEQYKASKYSRKFLAEHEGEIALYRASRATFDSILNGGKLPKMDKLKTEWQELTAQKKIAYKEYRAARSEMQGVLTVKANIDALLGMPQQEKNKEQER